jgi:hypothetical protein
MPKAPSPSLPRPRGRPSNDKRRVALAEGVLVSLVTEEINIAAGHVKGKGAKQKGKPLKAHLLIGIEQEAAKSKEKAVTSRYAEKAWAENQQAARNAIAADIAARLDARDELEAAARIAIPKSGTRPAKHRT